MGNNSYKSLTKKTDIWRPRDYLFHFEPQLSMGSDFNQSFFFFQINSTEFKQIRKRTMYIAPEFRCHFKIGCTFSVYRPSTLQMKGYGDTVSVCLNVLYS